MQQPVPDPPAATFSGTAEWQADRLRKFKRDRRSSAVLSPAISETVSSAEFFPSPGSYLSPRKANAQPCLFHTALRRQPPSPDMKERLFCVGPLFFSHSFCFMISEACSFFFFCPAKHKSEASCSPAAPKCLRNPKE